MTTPIYLFKEHSLIVLKSSPDTLSLLSDYLSDFANHTALIPFERTDSVSCCVSSIPANTDIPDTYTEIPLYELIEENPEKFIITAYAYQLVHWDQLHQFCSKCGSPMEAFGDERAKKCTQCEHLTFPAAHPAVVVRITKGDRILLVKTGPYTPYDGYSSVAGYLNQGETLEECAEREVMEETGITIKNMHYFGSQPFGLTNAIMIAYTAEWESGEITIDGEEIVEAEWYTRDTIPQPIPPTHTLSGQLIRKFMNILP
ncbi:MAG: NAD(+) diphosphatase [Fibrobacterales bacterium]